MNKELKEAIENTLEIMQQLKVPEQLSRLYEDAKKQQDYTGRIHYSELWAKYCQLMDAFLKYRNEADNE